MIRLFVGLFIFVIGVNYSQAEVVNNDTELKKEVEAKGIVLEFQNQLIDTMKQGETLGYKGRYEKLESVVVSSHDLTKIARIVVGKEWKKFTNEQKLKLTDIFSRLSIATYAYNFKSYSGESFRYLSEDETARGALIVHSVLVKPEHKD
jgi:phospholipid transport system substrate-binding protein